MSSYSSTNAFALPIDNIIEKKACITDEIQSSKVIKKEINLKKKGKEKQ